MSPFPLNPLKLRSGRYFGAARQERATKRLRLIETQYRPEERLPRHFHESAYLCVVLRGEFEESSHRREHRCGRGTLIYNAAAEPHSDAFCPRGGRVLNIELSGDLAASWLDAAAPRLTPLRYAFAGAALPQVGRIEAELGGWNAESELAIESAVCDLLAELGRASIRERRAPAWLARVKALLHERQSGHFGLDELARVAAVHPAHLSRTFQRFEHCSPGEYARRLRADAAWRWITTSAKPLHEIALDCGFADQSHMTRILRIHYGRSPGRVRRAQQPVAQAQFPF